MDKADALGQERIGVLLRRFSLPAIAGMVVNALYNVIDSIFVGQGVGEVGLAAVTVAFPLMILLMGVGMMVSIGAATLVSIHLGRQNRDEAELILGNAVTVTVILALLSASAVLWRLEELLVLFGATPEVLPYAVDFTFIIFAGSLFMHLSFGLNGIIRAQGDPRTALNTMLIGAVINTILNPLFIFYLQWGIKGSALATVISQAVSSLWVLAYFVRGAGVLRLRRRHLAVRGATAVAIVKLGMAPFLMQIGGSLVMVSFNHALFQYGGNLAIAAFGIINRVQMLILMPVIGISQGAQPIIGYNFGAGRYDRVLQTVKLAVVAATVLCGVGFMAVIFGSEYIVRLFNSNPDLVIMGSTGLALFLAMLPVNGLQLVGANYFQAVGKVGYAVFFNLLRQILVLVPMIYLLPRFFNLQGIWLAGPVADAVAVLVTGFFLLREAGRLRRIGATASAKPVRQEE